MRGYSDAELPSEERVPLYLRYSRNTNVCTSYNSMTTQCNLYHILCLDS